MMEIQPKHFDMAFALKYGMYTFFYMMCLIYCLIFNKLKINKLKLNFRKETRKKKLHG